MKFPALLCALLLTLRAGAAEIPRALPPGTLPDDPRLGALKDYDGYFPFTPPTDRTAWEQRAEEVRMQMRVALGLWPEPTRTPLQAVVHGRIEQADYTVEKVFFESMPGFFVTGNLYRPKGKAGPHPAVLCAHGHWKEARFALRTDAEMKKEIESGGELLAESGRSMFQSIGVQLARMGCVAFVYDMIGYCDSLQLSFELAHRFAKQRPEANTREHWGMFSPQAEAHAQNIMGLQTWNSIRAVDFLTALPDVDAKRLAITGASGGGTQTQMLAALDPRITVACPAVMPSTAMQGGCTCENASLLRVGTGNMEFAALFAPKPQGMTAANDWTKELETKGFPELKQHYALLGAPDKVALWAHINFGHNYNAVTRAHIYAWFNQHFALGLGDAQLVERDYPLLPQEKLTVWDTAHPAPPGGVEFEKKLLRWWHEDAQAQLAKASEKIAPPAWRTLLGWRGETATEFTHYRALKFTGGGKSYVGHSEIERARDGSYAVPRIVIETPRPTGAPVVLWLSERGKAGLFDTAGNLRPDVCRLLDAGALVVGLDLFGQGEFLADGQAPTQTRVVKNPREFGGYTFGYNHSLFAQRVHDVCNALTGLRQRIRSGLVGVIALDGTGPIAAVALSQQTECRRAVIQTGGFRFADLLELRAPHFLPAAAKYGDLPGALTLARQNIAEISTAMPANSAEIPQFQALARRNAGRILVLGEGTAEADPIGWYLGTTP